MQERLREASGPGQHRAPPLPQVPGHSWVPPGTLPDHLCSPARRDTGRGRESQPWELQVPAEEDKGHCECLGRGAVSTHEGDPAEAGEERSNGGQPPSTLGSRPPQQSNPVESSPGTPQTEGRPGNGAAPRVCALQALPVSTGQAGPRRAQHRARAGHAGSATGGRAPQAGRVTPDSRSRGSAPGAARPAARPSAEAPWPDSRAFRPCQGPRGQQGGTEASAARSAEPGEERPHGAGTRARRAAPPARKRRAGAPRAAGSQARRRSPRRGSALSRRLSVPSGGRRAPPRGRPRGLQADSALRPARAQAPLSRPAAAPRTPRREPSGRARAHPVRELHRGRRTCAAAQPPRPARRPQAGTSGPGRRVARHHSAPRRPGGAVSPEAEPSL